MTTWRRSASTGSSFSTSTSTTTVSTTVITSPSTAGAAHAARPIRRSAPTKINDNSLTGICFCTFVSEKKEDDDENIGSNAVRALGKICGARTMGLLIKAHKDAKSDEERKS